MISIIEHIEYLMIGNDCVVIPNWGAFIAQYYTSEHDHCTHTFSKPSRRIGFNASINHSDGLLATSIMRRHDITYKEATRLIQENVAVYKQLLQDSTEIPFGRLGFFTRNNDGGMEFIPFYHEMGNDAFFGLMDFTFNPLQSHRTSMVQPATSVATGNESPIAQEQQPSTQNWFSSKALQIAASIIILLGLVLVFSTPVILDKQQQLATMNMANIAQGRQAPVIAVSKKIEQPATRSKAVSTHFATRKATPPMTASPQKQEAKQPEIKKNDTLPEFTNKDRGRYYLVISTLTSSQQVKTYLATHQTFKNIAKVRVKNGKYRVYIERGDNYGDMMKKAKCLPSEYSDAWVTTD